MYFYQPSMWLYLHNKYIHLGIVAGTLSGSIWENWINFLCWDAVVSLCWPCLNRDDVLGMWPWVRPSQYIRPIKPWCHNRKYPPANVRDHPQHSSWLMIWRYKLMLSYFTKVFNMPDWAGWVVIYASEPGDGDTGRKISPFLYLFSPLSDLYPSLPNP